MLRTFFLTCSWSSRAQLGRLQLKLNPWQRFSTEGRRSLIKTVQDEKPKPASAMAEAMKQETAILNTIIRRTKKIR